MNLWLLSGSLLCASLFTFFHFSEKEKQELQAAAAVTDTLPSSRIIASDSTLSFEHYPRFLQNVREWRLQQQKAWNSGRNKDSLRRHWSVQLQAYIRDSIYYYWQGTVWNFYGTTRTPRFGTIACGYFVSTALKDLGFNIDRVAMAETYSEKFIRNMVRPRHIKKFVPFQIDTLLNRIPPNGDAIYVIGLDYHIGFLVCRDGQVDFLHSSFQNTVIKEPGNASWQLAYNQYGITGSLTADTALLRSWIMGRPPLLNQ